MIYDTLTTRYTFACPEHGDTRVALSRFRRLERLPGATHPAVFRIHFECGCGESFLNLMTARLDALEPEFADLAATKIGAGEWPWSFFCYPENQPRPVFPSSFSLISPSGRGGAVGIAVCCPVCGRTSINLVSEHHVDLPFHNDAEIGVVEHVFASDATQAAEEFAAELYSARFDARRLSLE